MRSDHDEEQMYDALDELEDCLDDDDIEGARQALARAERCSDGVNADLLYGRASLAFETEGSEAAEQYLQEAIALDPQHADAHYALAAIAEEREDEATMIEHHLRVLDLDAQHDREAQLGTPEELDAIEGVARAVLDGLPAPYGELLANVPVLLERRPSRLLVLEGFDPRAFGLFEGPTHGERDVPAPTRIVLYTHNLLADFPDPEALEEEVEITLLHEIGHYFNLDEEDMVRLGLD